LPLSNSVPAPLGLNRDSHVLPPIALTLARIGTSSSSLSMCSRLLAERDEFELSGDFINRQSATSETSSSRTVGSDPLFSAGQSRKPPQSSRPDTLGAPSAVKTFTASGGGPAVLYRSLPGSFFFVAALCAAGRRRLVRSGWRGLECSAPHLLSDESGAILNQNATAPTEQVPRA